MRVYVVTMPELGRDCVIGVYDYDSVTYEDLRNIFGEDQYAIHEPRDIEYRISGFDDD